MVLELHIWGPAFSLPSIDAQCIAAVAYMTQAVPRGEWALVASSDPLLSPTKELPALKSESVWIGGFRNIVDYVAQFSGGTWSLDVELEGRESADCVAFSSFVEAHGQLLIDLSLYVSTQNYTTITRTLYSSIQPFPLPYITPSSIRSAAKSRTFHLGLTSLDIDSDPNASDEPSKNEGVIPPSLRKPRTTISSLFSQNPENVAQIRLNALANSFLEPLQSLRGKKRYFISQSPTSLDCLALGYLSLALLPDLPSPWLTNCMRTKYPQLCAFVHDLQRSCFAGPVSLEDAYLVTSSLSGEEAEKERERMRRANGKAALPWSPPDRGGVLALGGILASSIADSIPGISQIRQVKRLERELKSAAEDEEDRQDAARVVSIHKRELWTSTAAVIGSVGLMVGYMLYYGLLTQFLDDDNGPEEGYSYHGDIRSLKEQEVSDEGGETNDRDRTGTGLRKFGEAGAALEVLTQSWPHSQQQPPVPVVEVDVEVDGQEV